MRPPTAFSLIPLLSKLNLNTCIYFCFFKPYIIQPIDPWLFWWHFKKQDRSGLRGGRDGSKRSLHKWYSSNLVQFPLCDRPSHFSSHESYDRITLEGLRKDSFLQSSLMLMMQYRTKLISLMVSWYSPQQLLDGIPLFHPDISPDR